MIVYTSACLSCFHKLRLKELREFCHKNNLSFLEKRTTYDRDIRKEASAYGLKLPFIVQGDKAIGLYDDLEALL